MTYDLQSPEAPVVSPVSESAQILVVEDDPEIGARLVRGLRGAGLDVELVVHGGQAASLDPSGYDLVILDLNLPERDGFDILERWRTRASTPVIVLTANLDLDSRLRTFDLGAVDYMPKPFWMEELLARVRTRVGLRQTARRTLSLGQSLIDFDARAAFIDGEDAGLTAVEFNVLACLLERPGRALSRRQLAELALPPDREHSDRVVDSHIARLRKKLPEFCQAIVTVWGIGYRFEEP